MDIQLVQPREDHQELEKLSELLYRCLNDAEHYRFLTYSLMPFDRETIRQLIETHKEQGVHYLVAREQDKFMGILAFKKSRLLGFELFLLAVDKEFRKKGVGHSLIQECMRQATSDNYLCIDSLVFADNKKMLRILIKNDFLPIGIQYHVRADGMDLVRLRKYFR